MFKRTKTGSETPGPIQVVQSAMAEPSSAGYDRLAEAFQAILTGEQWRSAMDANGTPFQSFSQFAIAASPAGLGLRTDPAARLARHVLMEQGMFGPWTDILELIARKPGRPQTIVNEEVFQRFYTVSRALTSRDRLLLQLKSEYPEIFKEKIIEEGWSPLAAAVHAGLLVRAEKSRMLLGVCDLEAAKRLRRVDQGKLLREVFLALSLEAQCELLAKDLTPTLGPELARKWRERKGPQV